MPDGAGGSRYHVHELVRDYAAEGLTACGDEALEEVRARHSDYFGSLASQAAAARDTEDEQPALVALEVDQANVDAALVRAVAAGQVDQALQLSSDLASLWIRSAPLERSAALLTRVLDLPWEPSSQAAISSRARALNLAGYTALAADECGLAELRFQEALSLSEPLADTRSAAQSLRGLGSAKGQSGDTAAGETSVQRSLTLCRSIGDDPGVAWSRYALGQIAFACGRVDEAAALLAEAVAAFARLGIGYGSYRAHAQLGELHSRRGSLESALASFGQAVVIQDRRLFVACGAEILEGIAGVAARMRRFELAASLLGAGECWREAFDRRVAA
jgi:tetratricopeptide (TPR) repeat protein